MKIRKSKEIIFFNMLGKLLSLNSEENSSVEILYTDLEKKMEMDRLLIAAFLEKLKDDKMVEIFKNGDETVSFKLNKTYDTLFDFVLPDKLEEILEDINDFVFKYINFFKFNNFNLSAVESVKEISFLLKEDPCYDISSELREGLQKMYETPELEISYCKLFFKLAEEIEEIDQRILEDIIYYFFNLPYEENPFLTTVFLFHVALSMESLKNEFSDSQEIFEIA